MAQHDYVIGNDDGASIRSDWNDLAAAIKSMNSHATDAPSAPVQGMGWCKLVSGTVQELYIYDGSTWVLVCTINPTTHAVTFPITKACFSAHKNGAAQGSITSATEILVTWPTEEFDVGSYFASNAWTPPAGKALLMCSLQYSNTNGVDNESLFLSLYKNGVNFKQVNVIREPATGAPFVFGSWIVDTNGTDAWTITAFKGGAGAGSLDGTVVNTYFMGHLL